MNSTFDELLDLLDIPHTKGSGWYEDKKLKVEHLLERHQLLQQTPCNTQLELLQQMLEEEQIAYMQCKNSMEADMRLYNEDALKVVIKLINARLPIA